MCLLVRIADCHNHQTHPCRLRGGYADTERARTVTKVMHDDNAMTIPCKSLQQNVAAHGLSSPHWPAEAERWEQPKWQAEPGEKST